jgi:hypothetical protein
MTYYYYCLSCAFLWFSPSVSSETVVDQTCCSLTSANLQVNNVQTHTNRMPHQMYTHADDQTSLPRDLVSHQRHHTSHLQHESSMITRRTHNNLQQLHHRLTQAKHALHMWPSSRTQDQVCLIERQIRQLDNPVALLRKSDDNVYTIR